MSDLSKLRDAVVAELQAVLTVPVASAVLLSPTLEELENGPLLLCRCESRGLEVDMGPDRLLATISCALFGRIPDAKDFENDQQAYRRREVEEIDKLDDVVETAIRQWVPNGPLSQKYLAAHRFNGLTQDQVMEPDNYQDFGIWAGGFRLTYYSDKDE